MARPNLGERKSTFHNLTTQLHPGPGKLCANQLGKQPGLKMDMGWLSDWRFPRNVDVCLINTLRQSLPSELSPMLNSKGFHQQGFEPQKVQYSEQTQSLTPAIYQYPVWNFYARSLQISIHPCKRSLYKTSVRQRSM